MKENPKFPPKNIPMEDGRIMVATYDNNGELRKTWFLSQEVSESAQQLKNK